MSNSAEDRKKSLGERVARFVLNPRGVGAVVTGCMSTAVLVTIGLFGLAIASIWLPGAAGALAAAGPVLQPYVIGLLTTAGAVAAPASVAYVIVLARQQGAGRSMLPSSPGGVEDRERGAAQATEDAKRSKLPKGQSK